MTILSGSDQARPAGVQRQARHQAWSIVTRQQAIRFRPVAGMDSLEPFPDAGDATRLRLRSFRDLDIREGVCGRGVDNIAVPSIREAFQLHA